MQMRCGIWNKCGTKFQSLWMERHLWECCESLAVVTDFNSRWSWRFPDSNRKVTNNCGALIISGHCCLYNIIVLIGVPTPVNTHCFDCPYSSSRLVSGPQAPNYTSIPKHWRCTFQLISYQYLIHVHQFSYALGCTLTFSMLVVTIVVKTHKIPYNAE